MSTESNKQVATRFLESISSGDTQALLESLADDVSYWVSIHGGVTLDKAEFSRISAGLPETFPEGMKITVQGITAEEDRVAIEAESSGIHASGVQYRNRYHFLFVIRDEKIKHIKEYMDSKHAEEVLGSRQAVFGR